MEVWKEIPDTEGRYQISSLGRIKSLPFMQKGNGSDFLTKERIIKLGADKDGYLCFVYSINCKRSTKRVHRLVANAFIPNTYDLPVINHIDSNRANNSVDNLEWCTISYNTKHGFEDGNREPTNGEINGMSTLTEEEVLEIRRLYSTGKYSYAKIAENYNVGPGAIGKVVRKERWKHI